MTHTTHVMIALIWLQLSAASVAQSPGSRTPPSAFDFMVEGIESLCRLEGDKIESAQRLIARGWRLNETADHYDKDFGVDAPVPLQNQHERAWLGPLADGRATLRVNITDYRDPARRDYFSATLLISPETAIDLDALQRRLGMTLRPLRPPHEGRRSDYSAIDLGGRPGPVFPRRYGLMQHFNVEPSPDGIEIEATRTWGANYPEQWLRISCSRRFEAPSDQSQAE